MKKYKFPVSAILMSLAIAGCKKSTSSPSVAATNYEQVNLVADTAGYNASRTDNNAANTWGMAFNPSGSVQAVMSYAGISEAMDANGNLLGTVTTGASPACIVYNNTTGFVNPNTGVAATFIYVAQNGIISISTSADTTLTVAGAPASEKFYAGATMANSNGANYLFATDLYNGIVDVYDAQFYLLAHNVTPFSDPQIPSGYIPFNIQNIGGRLYVTYAKQNGTANTGIATGAGFGYVDIFSGGGILLKRFASQGTLNAPYGIAQAPSGFSEIPGAILVGNFGDGRVNVFDTSGNYKGQLESSGSPISIAGLRAIAFPPSGTSGFVPSQLYFTAAPQNEAHGLFGYIKVK